MSNTDKPTVAACTSALDNARANVAACVKDLDEVTAEHDAAITAYNTAADEYDADPSDTKARAVTKARDARDLLSVRLDRSRRRLDAATAGERLAVDELGRARARADVVAAEAAYANADGRDLATTLATMEGAQDALAALDPEYAAELLSARVAAARTALDSAEHGYQGARDEAREAGESALSHTMGATIGTALERLAAGERRTAREHREAEQGARVARTAMEAARDRLAALDPGYRTALPGIRADEASDEQEAAREADRSRCSLDGFRAGLADVIALDKAIEVLKEKRAALFAAALAGYNDASERAEPAISGNGGLWGTSRVIIAANAWIALECGTMKNDTARRMLEDLTWQYAPSNGLGGSVPQQPTPEARLRACLTRGIDVVRQEDTIGDTAHQIGLLVNATDNPQPDHVIYAGRAASRELSYRHEHGRRNEAREAMLTEKIASAARFLADHLSIADRPLDIGDLRIVIPSGPWPGWTVKRRVAAWLKCSPDLVPERAKPSAEREQADEL